MDRANKAAILMLAFGIEIFLENAKASMWNNPHGGATAQNVRYAAILEAPKSLDPARAYSFNEVRIIAKIYEPALQYHYLKRPYRIN